MTVDNVNPNEITISDLNERQEDVEIGELKESIRDEGILHPPIVRESHDNDYKYEAFIGQRRVLAAQELDIDTIDVVVSDRDDKDALKASIVENINIFRQDVSSTDRAKALKQLWNLMGGEGFPSPTELEEELQVPESTIRTWLEPLHWEEEDEEETEEVTSDPDEKYDDEVVDDEGQDDDLTEVTEDREPDGPDVEFENTGEVTDDMGEIDEPGYGDGEETEENEMELSEEEVSDTREEDDEITTDPQLSFADEIGERKLTEIRQMVGTGETGEKVAEFVAENNLTQKQLEEARTLYERDVEIMDALSQVVEREEEEDDESDTSEKLNVEATLTGETAESVREMAENRQTTESVIVEELVEEYVDTLSVDREE